jgi:uncharacterized tellurite resistance protein B-like protein
MRGSGTHGPTFLVNRRERGHLIELIVTIISADANILPSIELLSWRFHDLATASREDRSV